MHTMAAAQPFYEPTLKNIIDQRSLQWIFVGGKGGVGKTTVSCSLAIQLSRVRESVLLVSMDPAHNLSDAFGHKFSMEPQLVDGFRNLYAMELDPTAKIQELHEELLNQDAREGLMPGQDEMIGMKMLGRLVERTNHSVVVFDTAPTGHTLRMLAAPMTLSSSFSGLSRVINQVAPVISHVANLLGVQVVTDISNAFQRGAQKAPEIFSAVTDMLKDADKTTFVCVCLAEFLPVYETERLIHQLTKYGIDTHNIVVNQLNIPQPGDTPCSLCAARQRMQAKYMEQITDLYEEDFHITKLPMMNDEVRKAEGLSSFSHHLLQPY